MTFAVKVEAGAERDWDEAVAFYDERDPGLGDKFNFAVREMLHTLSREAVRFRLFTRLTHKAKMPRPWPHSVYFTVDKKLREVKVVAIWHGARNPDDLRRRLE